MLIDDFKLITSRHKLILRPHRESDAPFMMELNADPAVTEYTPDGPLPSFEVAKVIVQGIRQQFLERQIGRFIVEDPKTGRAMGWCGLKWLEESQEIDLGYRFLKSTWGQGIATDAARCCLDYGFQKLHFPTITAKVLPSNIGSIRVLAKLGMTEIGKVIEDEQEYIHFSMTSSAHASASSFFKKE